MPLKLIGTIILLVLVTIFCGFNLEDANKCDINLIFHTFKSVPVFLTVLSSFLIGIILMLPFAIFKNGGKKNSKSEKTEKSAKNTGNAAVEQKTSDTLNGSPSGEKPSAEEKTIFDLKIRSPIGKKQKEQKKTEKKDGQ